MEVSNASHYVYRLEKQIHELQEIIREWAPYVPQELIQRSQSLIEIPLTLHSHSFSSDSELIQGQRSIPSKQSNREPEWSRHLKAFIKKIPPAKKWPDTAPGSSVSVLDLIFRGDAPPERGQAPILETQCQTSNPLQIVEAYASFAKRFSECAQWSKLIASYQKLLLGVLCHVACCMGVDPKLVDKMMGMISKGQAAHLQELRLGAVWAVEATDRLQAEGNWDIRSGDIVFYCKWVL